MLLLFTCIIYTHSGYQMSIFGKNHTIIFEFLWYTTRKGENGDHPMSLQMF